MRQAPIEYPLEDPTTGAMVYKVVFVLFFQGDALRTRVRKICEGFRATLYQCPETPDERREMETAVSNRIVDLENVLQTTQDHSVTQLEEIGQQLDMWQQKVTKVKAIYHTLNMFNLDMAQHCLVAECWCPVEDLDEIQRALITGTERSGSTVPSILNRMYTKDSPPTYFKTNKFTSGFQSIVDAYGVATYQEVNPALYTIITFPFLFAVMFGDAGHGLIMALFAFAMIIFEKKLMNSSATGEMFGIIFGGRYIIFLMGLFSIYTGIIYNDFFSLSVNVFGTHWDVSYINTTNPPLIPGQHGCCANATNNFLCVINDPVHNHTILPAEAQLYLNPYPFGLDPIWQVSENKLKFINSYKMKMSIILGVIQMSFGVLLGLFNYVHFKRYFAIISDFIPQILFLLCIFGWLCVMMFVKWCMTYDPVYQAPSLLIATINMFLQFAQSPKVTCFGEEEASGRCSVEDNQYSVFGPTQELATFQKAIQTIFVIIAVACIPWMLLVNPIYKIIKIKAAQRTNQYTRHYDAGESEAEASDDQILGGDSVKHHDEKDQPKHSEHDEEEHLDYSEIFVHQAIHTIEYCLGTISNTASYLRLWALSLAHAELSEVLWQMVLSIGIGFGAQYWYVGGLMLFFLFKFWAILTIGILLVMEGLSAFLHGLRLHWVEFQSKFYQGEGYKFKPFSFEAILVGEED
jgi:V-type H+-transporting ATPase subunit a